MSDAWRKVKKAVLSFKQPKPKLIISNNNNKPNSHNSKSPSIQQSSSSFFSRSFSTTTTQSSKRTCAICLGSIKAGNGQAIFTAECSHSFHFSCIGNSVKHGNRVCPICRCKWKEIPFQLPTFSNNVNGTNAGGARVSPYHTPVEDPAGFSRPLPTVSPSRPQHVQFSDDEPLLSITMDHSTSASVVHSGNILMKSFVEFPAVAASETVTRFAVLVGLRAPSLLEGDRHLERAPIDLVTVLDVSGSMNGSKLTLLKQAVCFVIDNLGPSDRLAIVTFSSRAQRNFPLRRMTEQGRQEAIQAINNISANGGTNIVEGLKIGARVLEERRERNPVASIILLSDGRDTYNDETPNQRNRNRNNRSSSPTIVPEYLSLLPSSLRPRNGVPEAEDLPTFAVHTFGFGSDHDSSAMHAVSDASGGTFSFIESVDTVQDAFAMCIGGLLSVVAQELQLSCKAVSPGVKIVSIPSGKYASEISEQGKQGVINIGDLYADEEKEFIVYLSIPSVEIAQLDERVETSLLLVVCSYKNVVSNELVRVEGEIIKIHRPQVLSPTDVIVSLEVDRQINRLAVAETILEAQKMAEMGNLEGAQALLANRRSSLLSSASAQAGDGLCNRLDIELTEIRERMASEELYDQMGRAYLLSGLSSHFWQRATTRGDTTTHLILQDGSSSNTGAIGYETPSMISMVSKSQSLTIGNPVEQVRQINKTSDLTPWSN